MLRDMLPYSILQYIVDEEIAARIEEPVKLPPIAELAEELGVSLNMLRQDLIIAQAFGVIEMRPGDGTYVLPFDFHSAIYTIVLYSTMCDWRNFDQLYGLRTKLETVYWEQATNGLNEKETERLQQLLRKAERKLGSKPVEIPHREHRALHLLIYSELSNNFVQGILRTYWDTYEAVGLHRYFDYGYYQEMWRNHRRMVEAILTDRLQEGKKTLVGHFTLLENRLYGGADREEAADVVHRKGGPPLVDL